MEMEDMNVLISQYPAIAAKAAEIGKIKQGMLNKKQYAQSLEQWKSFTPEELAKLNSEIASAPVVMKKAVFTQTAICYNSESVLRSGKRSCMGICPRGQRKHELYSDK